MSQGFGLISSFFIIPLDSNIRCRELALPLIILRRGDISFADFVKDSLGLLQLKMPDVEEIKGRAWDGGYNQAMEEYQIWYYCAVCRERMDTEPNSDSHKAMIGYMSCGILRATQSAGRKREG